MYLLLNLYCCNCLYVLPYTVHAFYLYSLAIGPNAYYEINYPSIMYVINGKKTTDPSTCRSRRLHDIYVLTLVVITSKYVYG